MREKDETFYAMRVHKGRIVQLYRKDEYRPEPGEKAVDLCGRHVYPCLIDPHTHMLLTVAVMATGFNVCEITGQGIEPSDLSGVEKKIRAYAATKKAGELIAVNNYVWSAMKERRMPYKEELDQWGGGRPVVLYNIDGHSTAMSSKMLKMCGIDPEGHNGILTGEENERVQGRITDVVGKAVSVGTLLHGIRIFEDTCRKYGICMVGALTGNGDSPKDRTTGLIAWLSRHLDVEVRLYLQYTDLSRVKPFTKWMKKKRVGGCGDWEMDGSAGSRSAAFSVPYKDTGSRAPCYMEQEEVDRLCAEADRNGYQIAAHAIGDAAIRRLYDGLCRTGSTRLHRIEHCEFADEETFAKISEGRFAVVAQPGYSWIDKRYLHTYEEALPEEVLSRMKLRSYFDAGVILCGSSDSPVQDINPFLQMQGMTEFYVAGESVTPYEALRSYTVHAAAAMEESEDYGTLEEGKIASFFTSKEDFFTLPQEKVISFRPENTWYKGRKCRKISIIAKKI